MYREKLMYKLKKKELRVNKKLKKQKPPRNENNRAKNDREM